MDKTKSVFIFYKFDLILSLEHMPGYFPNMVWWPSSQNISNSELSILKLWFTKA